jgi:autotransporter-associated beta strand protein
MAQTWVGNFSGNWGGPNNWNPIGIPASSNNTQLTFGATANASMQNAITDPNPFILNRLTFNAGSPTYLLSTDPLDFRLKGVASFPAIAFNSSNGFTIDGALILTDNFSVFGTGSGTVTLNQAISGPGSLTYSGAGTLTLAAVESYTGGTFVTSGTLNMSAFSALPTGQNVTVGNGSGPAVFNFQSIGNSSAGTAIGTLTLNGGTFQTHGGDFYFSQLVMTGGSVDTSAASSGCHLHLANSAAGITVNASSTTATWIGAMSIIQNDTSAPLTITVNAGTTPSGIDLDAGMILANGTSNKGFTKAGAGTMRLTSPNNIADITVSGGNLRVDDIAALGGGSLTLNGGTLRYGGPNATLSKNLPISAPGTPPPASTIQVLSPGTNLTLSGTISDAVSSNGLVISGPGAGASAATLTLMANNTYAGNTYIGGNAIAAIPTIANVGDVSPIGMGSPSPLALQLGGNSLFGVNTSRGTLLLTGTNPAYSTDRGLTVIGTYANQGGGALGVQNNGTNLTWTGPVTDFGTPGSLIKTGGGTLTLTYAGNQYTGGTYVEAGTLTVGAAGAVIPANTDVTVSAGATLALGFNGDTSAAPLGTLTLNGGTFGVVVGAHVGYYLTQLVTGAAGGTVDFTAGGTLYMRGSPRVTINGNTSWIGNSQFFNNASLNEMDVIISLGATLTNGLTFVGSSAGPFHISGGGTLYMSTPPSTAPAYYVVSQGRLRVDDLTVNGIKSVLGSPSPGFLTLDGGILQYSGSTGAGMVPISLTSSGGTLEVSNPATTLTYSGAVSGFGPFIKGGPGVLILGNLANTYASGLIINGGRIDVSDDAQLGASSPTVNPAGTLRYTASTTTARTFNLAGGTLEAPTGVTLTLNGAAVNGGFLRGAGTFIVNGGTTLSGMTTFGSTTVNVNGPATFVNYANGGPLNISAAVTLSGFSNKGGGAITVLGDYQVNAADFESYGTLTLNLGSLAVPTRLTNTGASPLYFNGGSRTFIGAPGGNGQARLELNGQNAIVAGGLFINNGQVTDSSALGISTVIADYGALVKGAGTFDNSPITRNGGKFQAGNSPGVATMGRFVFGPGGVNNYVFAIDDATGTPGPTPDAAGHVSGWGLVKATQWQRAAGMTSGDFAWTADVNNKLTFAIDTLVNPTTAGTDIPGLMSDFDPSRAYSWPAVEWSGTYSGPTDVASLIAATNFDISAFQNPIGGTFGWALDAAGHSLSLTYTPTPVPEPGTLALLVAAASGWLSKRHSGVLFDALRRPR